MMLLLPFWILATALQIAAVFIVAKTCGGWNDGDAFCWMIFSGFGSTIPVGILLNAYEREKARRIEIENRWKKELQSKV